MRIIISTEGSRLPAVELSKRLIWIGKERNSHSRDGNKSSESGEDLIISSIVRDLIRLT